MAITNLRLCSPLFQIIFYIKSCGHQHHFFIAGGNFFAVDNGCDTFAADLFHIAHAAAVNRVAEAMVTGL